MVASEKALWTGKGKGDDMCPYVGADGRWSAFLKPESLNDLMIELGEVADDC